MFIHFWPFCHFCATCANIHRSKRLKLIARKPIMVAYHTALLWTFSVINVYYIEHASNGNNKYLKLIFSWKEWWPVTRIPFMSACLESAQSNSNNKIIQHYFNHLNPAVHMNSMYFHAAWLPQLPHQPFSSKNHQFKCSERHGKSNFLLYTRASCLDFSQHVKLDKLDE